MKKYDSVAVFKKNLYLLRKRRGLSQRALAAKIGATQRLVAYYETNAPNIPLSKVQDIAEALNVTIVEMLETRRPKDAAVEELDVRTVRKIQQINKLPRRAREALWQTINATLKAHALEKERSHNRPPAETQ